MAQVNLGTIFPNQEELGECIRYHRQEIMGWSIEYAVELTNDLFKLDDPITFHAWRDLEIPARTRKAPRSDILVIIASLAALEPPFLRNPATGQAFSDRDLQLIAMGKLNWKTGDAVNDIEKRTKR